MSIWTLPSSSEQNREKALVAVNVTFDHSEDI